MKLIRSRFLSLTYQRYPMCMCQVLHWFVWMHCSSVASLWRCTTITNPKKFIWSQRKGSAEQFKEGGTYGQSHWELESTLLLRHSMSRWIFDCVLATCQEHTSDTLSIIISKWGSGSPLALQVQLTTLIGPAEVWSSVTAPLLQDQFSLSFMTLSLDVYYASPCQGKPWSIFKSGPFISILETSVIPPQQLLEHFSASKTRRAHTCQVIILGSLLESWCRKVNNVLYIWLWSKGKHQCQISQTLIYSFMEKPSTQPGMQEQSYDGLSLTSTAAEIASLFPAVPLQHKSWGHTEQAGVSRQEKDILGREFMGNTARKMLPLERCCNKDKMLQMSTGYHRIPEKPHSFSAAELFIHKIVFISYIQVITDSFCTARAALTSSVRLFIAAAAQAESGTSA